MKKVFSVLCAILIASSMILSVFAADVSPKVEVPQVVEVVVTDAEGNEIELEIPAEEMTIQLELTTIEMVVAEESGEETETTVAPEVKEDIKKADEALKAMESLAEVHEDLADKEVLSVMNIQFSEKVAEAVSKGATVSVKTTLKMTPKVDAETKEPVRIPVIRFVDGKWVVSEDEYAEVLEDGTVVVHVNQAGSFTLVVDPEDEIVDTNESK